MSYITVYRVENDFQEGPYASDEFDEMILQHGRDCDGNHPAPFQDGLERAIHLGHTFGFLSLIDLAQWFDGWLPSLREADFRIVSMEVPRQVLMRGTSGRQVTFDRKQGINVREI